MPLFGFWRRFKTAVQRFWLRLFGRKRQPAAQMNSAIEGKLLPPASIPGGPPIVDAEFEVLPNDPPPVAARGRSKPAGERSRRSWFLRSAKKAEQQAEEEAKRTAEAQAAQRKAEEQALTKRKAEEEAEARRKAEEEALTKRKAAEEAEAKRRAAEEAEAKRRAEEEARAEAKRKAEEEAKAEGERQAEEEARAEAKRKAEEVAKVEKLRARERQKDLHAMLRRMAVEANVALRAFQQLRSWREQEESRAQRESNRRARLRMYEAEVAAKAFAQLVAQRALEAEQALEREAGEEEAARIAAVVEAERRRRRRAWEQVVVPKDYMPAPESNEIIYQLDLDAFEGPLDLLLFLIRRHQIDIFDIPMSFICERYLEYMDRMKDLNIDVAAEFMFMAAELLHIKSKMLLPQPEELEDDEETDPRADLVRRLLEYQKYKEAAEAIARFEWLGRDTFGREPEKIPIDRGALPLREVGVFALIEAFDTILQKKRPELLHQVMMEEVSIAERLRSFVQKLAGKDQVRFEEMLGVVHTRIDIVVSFLAMLEMTKMRMLSIYQSLEGALYLSPRFKDVETAMQQIAGLDESQYAG